MLFEFFCVYVGVALSISGFCLDKIGELFAKYSEIHVAVKINYYNILNLGLYKHYNSIYLKSFTISWTEMLEEFSLKTCILEV